MGLINHRNNQQSCSSCSSLAVTNQRGENFTRFIIVILMARFRFIGTFVALDRSCKNNDRLSLSGTSSFSFRLMDCVFVNHYGDRKLVDPYRSVSMSLSLRCACKVSTEIDGDIAGLWAWIFVGSALSSRSFTDNVAVWQSYDPLKA